MNYSLLPFLAALAPQLAAQLPVAAVPSVGSPSDQRQSMPPDSAVTTGLRDAAIVGQLPAAARTAMPPLAQAGMQQPQHVLFDRPSGERGELWALGSNWKASFDGRGTTFVPFFGADAPHNFPLRIELASASVGADALALVEGQPQVEGGVVRTARGALTETIATALQSIEQTFVFQSLPNRGALALDITLQGEFTAVPIADGVEFRSSHGSVRYTKAVAFDAAGASLPLTIEWDGDSAHLTVPADFVASATLPLVIDPIVANTALTSVYSGAQRYPDVATLQNPDRSLVVWQQQFSANDWDCFAAVMGSNLSVISSPITLDFTGFNWQFPKAASNAIANNFLVVAQIDAGGTSAPWIGGRTVGATGVTGAVLDIERDGVVGLPGYNYTPDIGGDTYSSGSLYCVVWAHTSAPANNRDIHFKMVDPSGFLISNAPTPLTNSAEDESAPSIAKDNRTSLWPVVFQKNYPFPPFDQDIWSATIGYGGSIAVAPFLVSTAVQDEIRPCVTSSATPAGSNPMHLIVWEQVSTSVNTDIRCAAFETGGPSPTIPLGFWNLSQTEAGGVFASRNQIFPKADSDGVRFVVGHSEYTGTDYDTFVSTIAYLPATNTIRFDETRVPLGSTAGIDDYWTPVCSYFSGGNLPSPLYVTAGANISTNTIPAWEYGGHQAGPLFYAYPFFACGVTPPTITPGGNPAIGSTVSFSVGATFGGTLFGTQGNQPLQQLLGCNCSLGVDLNGLIVAGNPLVFAIPPAPMLVGTIWSVQGFGVSGSNCLGLFDLTDTIDFFIR